MSQNGYYKGELLQHIGGDKTRLVSVDKVMKDHALQEWSVGTWMEIQRIINSIISNGVLEMRMLRTLKSMERNPKEKKPHSLQ